MVLSGGRMPGIFVLQILILSFYKKCFITERRTFYPAVGNSLIRKTFQNIIKEN